MQRILQIADKRIRLRVDLFECVQAGHALAKMLADSGRSHFREGARGKTAEFITSGAPLHDSSFHRVLGEAPGTLPDRPH